MTVSITIDEAAERLETANRVLVIGCSGGGKSTLSKALAARFDILKMLVARERWIMDGSNPSTFDLRVPRSDLVIWVRMPRLTCLLGVARRVWRYHGTVRPEMAAGCPEPLPDRTFLDYIWNFERKSAPVFIRKLEQHGEGVPLVTLSSRREARRLLTRVGA
jgi:adenylate kinase family enzyme